MAGTPNPRNGLGFWSRVLDLDLRHHRRRRSMASMARDYHLPERRLVRWVNNGFMPAADIAARIARAVDMPGDEFLALLSGEQVAASSGSVTPE